MSTWVQRLPFLLVVPFYPTCIKWGKAIGLVHLSWSVCLSVRPMKGATFAKPNNNNGIPEKVFVVSLKSHVAQYCRLHNACLVQYSPLTVFGLFHYRAPALSP